MTEQQNIEINMQQFVETIAGAAMGQGLVLNEKVDFVAERKHKQLIVIAAAPKSGSTFLANTLCRLTKSRYFRLCSGYSTNEHDLYLPALCMMNRYGCVSQLHMKGTFHNAALMKQFGIRPIILVRNIFDSVISLKHDLRAKQKNPAHASGLDGYSFFWQDESIKNLTDDQLIEAIIDLAIPWYVNFYVSWFSLCEKSNVDAMWVTYEQLFEHKESTLKSIMNYLGYSNIDRIDENILSNKYGTFRKGSSGEGESELTDNQKHRIRQHFEYYSHVDFSRFGI